MSSTVAVVIPTFNSALTIERALISVLVQTQLPNEVIVIDNASADDTIALVHAFAAKHQDVTWKIEALSLNVGPGAARNLGWDIAESDLIAFLDSDDSWLPEKLEMQCETVDRHPESSLFGHRYIVVLQDEAASWSQAAGNRPVIDRFDLGHFLLRNRLSTPTVMLRRTIPERFPTEFWHAEDYALWLRIVAVHGPAIFQRHTLTLLHKSTYGDSGLSSNLAQMHRGELRAVRHLRQTHNIGMFGELLVNLWLRVKYFRRRILMFFGRERR